MSSRSSARDERPRDSGRDRDVGTYRPPRNPARESGRDRDGAPLSERGGKSNRSRSPRRERGGRRSDNGYRARSPLRGNDRDRERERDRDGGRGGRGDRSSRDEKSSRDDRSSRSDYRGREPPSGPRGGGVGGRNSEYKPAGGPVKPQPKEEVKVKVEESKDEKMEDQSDRPEGMDDESWAMYNMMGFAGFKSTKDTKVPGNDKNWGIRKEKELKARQYMNRQGGFNRPLSPSRDA